MHAKPAPTDPQHPPAGRVDRVETRVRYGETDKMGVVHHAHTFTYFEMGRTEYMRSLGIAYRELEASGTMLVVAD